MAILKCILIYQVHIIKICKKRLDEPEYYNLAYHIGFDTTYTGFMTVPNATECIPV